MVGGSSDYLIGYIPVIQLHTRFKLCATSFCKMDPPFSKMTTDYGCYYIQMSNVFHISPGWTVCNQSKVHSHFMLESFLIGVFFNQIDIAKSFTWSDWDYNQHILGELDNPILGPLIPSISTRTPSVRVTSVVQIGANSAPLHADVLSYWYEADLIQKSFKEQKKL